MKHKGRKVERKAHEQAATAVEQRWSAGWWDGGDTL